MLSNVSVRFPLHGSRGPSGTVPNSPLGGLIGRARRGPSYVDALNDVSLRLRGGDRLGIIGHNGSGKSTLLRVIGSIYEPWRGTVEVSGRVLSLADPMLGMNHECTGRENVVLRGIFMV